MPQAEYRAGSGGCGLVSVFDIETKKLKRLEDFDGSIIVNVGLAGKLQVTPIGRGKGFFTRSGLLRQKVNIGIEKFAGAVPFVARSR